MHGYNKKLKISWFSIYNHVLNISSNVLKSTTQSTIKLAGLRTGG